MNTITSPDRHFVPEQWQVQMWAKVFEKLGVCKNFLICALQLEKASRELIPGTNLSSVIDRHPSETNLEFLQRITQQAIDQLILKQPDISILILPDGPYAVPVAG